LFELTTASTLFPISYTSFCTARQATNHSAGRKGDGAGKIPRRAALKRC